MRSSWRVPAIDASDACNDDDNSRTVLVPKAACLKSPGDHIARGPLSSPAIYPYRLFAEVGGLLSYGVEQTDNFRRAAIYVDRILKGEKPSELPVQAPGKFELVVNLKTAKALGLTIPGTFLQRADEVIE